MFEPNKYLNKNNLLFMQLDSDLRGNDGRETFTAYLEQFCKGLRCKK